MFCVYIMFSNGNYNFKNFKSWECSGIICLSRKILLEIFGKILVSLWILNKIVVYVYFGIYLIIV